MRFTRSLLTTTLLLAASIVAAHADTFSYDFSYPGGDAAFTYTSPTLLGVGSSFVPTTCTAQGPTTCTGVNFTPDLVNKKLLTIALTDADISFSQGFTGLPASFLDIGTHVFPLAGPLTLTITDIPASPVPEPSSLALFGTGILGFAGAARRGFRRQ